MLLGLRWIISLRLSLKGSCYCKRFDFSTLQHSQTVKEQHLWVHHILLYCYISRDYFGSFFCFLRCLTSTTLKSTSLVSSNAFHWLGLCIYFRHWFRGAWCLSGGLRFGLQWVLQRSQCKFAAVCGAHRNIEWNNICVPNTSYILIVSSMYIILRKISILATFCTVQTLNNAVHALCISNCAHTSAKDVNRR